MNELVTLHTQALRGAVVPGYLEGLVQGLSGARLNNTFPDRRRVQGSLEAMKLAMDHGLYEQVYVDARAGMPNLASFTRVLTDHELASGSLSRMSATAVYEQKRDEAEVYARLLEKRRYLEAIQGIPYAPLDEHRVQLRRHDPATGTAEFRLDLTKLDATGLFVRITIELTQVASAWRRKVIDLDADGESAAANDAFHATVYRNAGYDAEHLFIHMHEIEGVSVDRVQRGVIGPVLFRLPHEQGAVVPAEPELGNPRLGHAWRRWLESAAGNEPDLIMCFQSDIAARDVREEKSNDPLENLLSANIQDSERPRYQHTRERFPFKVFKDRKFVVSRGAEALVKAVSQAAGTKNLILGCAELLWWVHAFARAPCLLGVVVLAAALLGACNRGPLPLDDTGTSDTGEPVPLPSCETFGQTASAWVVSDELDRYKIPGGVLAGEDQMLAVWRRGFNGSNPDPNLMARPLDVDGKPLGPSFALTQRNVPNGPFVRPSSDGHWLLTQCARFGYEDRAAPFRIDVTGNVSQDMFVIPPDDQFCGAHDPMGIWTGQRHMVAWTDNSTDELRFAVLGEQLDDVSTTLLAPDGDLSAPPRFAISQGTVILASGLEQDRISIWYSSLDGELLGDPTEVAFDIESESPADLAITPTSDGAIIWAVGRWNGGLYRIELDADGELLSGPTPMPGWEGWLLDDSDVSPAPGGYMMAFTAWDDMNNFIVWAHVDADGVLGQPQVYGDELEDFYIAHPRLNAREGRIFMSYSASLDPNGDMFEIRLAEFGCVE